MTDTDRISVDFALLRELAGELEDILAQLTERLALLHEAAKKVVLTWDGEAREAFVTALDLWSADIADLRARQAWLHEVVTTAHTNYRAAHRAVLRGWGAA